MDNSTASEKLCNFCGDQVKAGDVDCDDDECVSGRPPPDPSCTSCGDTGFQSHECPDCRR